MTLEENKAIVRRQFDLVERRDQGALDEVMAADVINHALGRMLVGIEPYKAILGAIHSAFPDEMKTIDDMIAEGDKVVVRATLKGKHRGSGIPMLAGIKPEGRPVEWQFIHIFRLRDGKIVEHWAQRNDLEVIQQLQGPPRLAAV